MQARRHGRGPERTLAGMICMVLPACGAIAVACAARAPARTQALDFVARGGGTSQFSDNLDDHNRAVNQYQRRMNQ